MLVGAESEAELHVAFYRTSSIGDVVLATAALAGLAELKVPVRVYWLGRNPSLSLLASAYPQLTTFEIKKTDSVAVVDKIRAQVGRLDLVIDLQKNLRSRMICSALAKPDRAGVYTWKKRGLQRSSMIMRSRFVGRTQAAPEAIQRPIIFQYDAMKDTLTKALNRHRARLQEDWQTTLHKAPPMLPVTHDKGEKSWQKELRYGKWLAIAPGAAHATKQAPATVFIEAIKALRELLAQTDNAEGVGLLFLGDENDRKAAIIIQDEVGWPYATLNLAGKLSLWESALALAQTSVLLSNDSSLAHIAEAVNTPVAVLFGPTVEAFGFAPRKEESRAFSSLLGCRPCSKHGKTECRYRDLLCFHSISTRSIATYLHARFHALDSNDAP